MLRSISAADAAHFDGTGFDLALYRTMKLDLALPNFGEMQCLLFDLPPGCIRISEAIVTVAALKPGVARLFTVGNAAEEVVERFAEALDDIL